MRRLTLYLLMVFILGSCSTMSVQPPQDILHDICWAHNLFAIYEREQLTFTFNAQLPDKVVQRQWVWHIKTNQVFLNGSEQPVSQAFINDIYWLLFPLKAYESRDQIAVSVHENKLSPFAKKASTEVVIRYVGGKGYTPDDTYKLYVDDNLILREWAYLKASQEPPARITAWSDYQTIGGVTLSLMREGRDGFKVWFTDVRLE